MFMAAFVDVLDIDSLVLEVQHNESEIVPGLQ
jgi:hypothetical protein